MRAIFCALILAFFCSLSKGDLSFQQLSYHVGYAQNSAPNAAGVAVFFAGYSVLFEDAQVWCGNVVGARLNAKHVFCVAGPEDALYKKREINTDALGKSVADAFTQSGGRVSVMAHSSGAFVAYAFFSSLFAKVPVRTPGFSVTYYCLDGGVIGLTVGLMSRMDKIVAVNALDAVSGVKSRNYAVMSGLSTWMRPKTVLYTCQVRTICKTPNCMHDALITHQPADPNVFDLHADYTNSDVQTDYLSITASAPVTQPRPLPRVVGRQ